MPRLSLRNKLLSIQVARDAWKASKGDPEQYEALARADNRLKMIDPATIIFIIELVMAAYKWFKNRRASHTEDVAESDRDILLGAIEFWKE